MRTTKRCALLAITVALVTTACTSTGTNVAPPPSPPSSQHTMTHHALACPSMPFVPRPISGDLERQALPEPARSDVKGGVFVHPLRLDHDALVVDPPGMNDRAAYDGNRALCEVLASTTANGFPINVQSVDTIAAGLARVTVADSILHRSELGAVTYSGSVDGVPDVNAKPPAPTPYRDRLAWVVVVQEHLVASCPAERSDTTPPPTRIDHSLHGYAVFIVDAATGGDALLYTERRNPICPGGGPSGQSVDVPLTSVSIPWTLVSEVPDRSSARIRFDVTPCDGYQGVAFADRPSLSLVRVVVTRPFGPPCGPEHPIVQKLRAAAIGTKLPPRLVHAALGPYAQ